MYGVKVGMEDELLYEVLLYEVLETGVELVAELLLVFEEVESEPLEYGGGLYVGVVYAGGMIGE